MGGIGAERGELHPTRHTRFHRPGSELRGRVMMHRFQRIRAAVHDADRVHHHILPGKERTDAGRVKRKKISLTVTRRGERMPTGAQHRRDAAADKTARAKKQNIHKTPVSRKRQG